MGLGFLFLFFSFIFSLTSAVSMVGGGKARETHLPLPQAHGCRDAAESLVRPGDYSGQATANWWGGFESRSSCNRMATGGGWTLLGGSKASASSSKVSCQTCHECLCQGTAREEQGTALKGLPWGCSSACGHGVGFASQILGPFLHWPQHFHCECAHCSSLAGSKLASLHPF